MDHIHNDESLMYMRHEALQMLLSISPELITRMQNQWDIVIYRGAHYYCLVMEYVYQACEQITCCKIEGAHALLEDGDELECDSDDFDLDLYTGDLELKVHGAECSWSGNPENRIVIDPNNNPVTNIIEQVLDFTCQEMCKTPVDVWACVRPICFCFYGDFEFPVHVKAEVDATASDIRNTISVTGYCLVAAYRNDVPYLVYRTRQLEYT